MTVERVAQLTAVPGFAWDASKKNRQVKQKRAVKKGGERSQRKYQHQSMEA
jgi:hypothetical protein